MKVFYNKNFEVRYLWDFIYSFTRVLGTTRNTFSNLIILRLPHTCLKKSNPCITRIHFPFFWWSTNILSFLFDDRLRGACEWKLLEQRFSKPSDPHLIYIKKSCSTLFIILEWNWYIINLFIQVISQKINIMPYL